MATYTCPTQSVEIWFPLDPTITELPQAPAIVQNPNPQPANTYDGVAADADLEIITADWGSVLGQACDTFSWGLITAAVDESEDYKELLTLWDLLPTDTAPVYAEEIAFDTLYPPYREITTQAFPVFLVAEVTRLDKLKFTLDLAPFTLFVKAAVFRPLLRDVDAVVRTTADVTELAGSLALPIRVRVFVEASAAASRLGMVFGLLAWSGDGPEPEQDVDAPIRVKAEVSTGTTTLDLPIKLVAIVESTDAIGMAFGIEVV